MIFPPDILFTIRNFRSAWFGGRYGGGKTALAVATAGYIVAAGWADKIYANFPMRWRLALLEDTDMRDAVIVLDEGWSMVETWDDVKAFAAFLRKRNLYVLIPSVFPPHQRLKFLSIMRIFNGFSVGIPAWFYSATLSGMGGKPERYIFSWITPDEIYGLYDTEAYPEVETEEIIKAALAKDDTHAKHKAKKLTGPGAVSRPASDDYTRRALEFYAAYGGGTAIPVQFSVSGDSRAQQMAAIENADSADKISSTIESVERLLQKLRSTR